MSKTPIKLGLLAIILLEIGVVFYMLNAYNRLVSNPENYFKKSLVVDDKVLDSPSIDNNN